MKHKEEKYTLARIKVIGVGGGGSNAITRMNKDFPRAVDLIAINTDVQDLNYCNAKKKIHIGQEVTKGLGAGMNPDLGRQSAEENRSEIADILKGADMVFITAGFGGGTGTGASPIIAEIARDLGILTIAVVTKPFSFEGSQRNQIAQEGIIKLKDKVDTLIVIPNDRIFSLIDKDTSLIKAFEKIDEVLNNSVKGITELIMNPGIVNVDFADVKTVMEEGGSAVIGIGLASGQERALSAANQAINSPLLETSIDGAKGVLFSISGRRDLKMNEVNEIAKLISENVDSTAKIIFGTYNDRRIRKGQIKVTLIATGFDNILKNNDITGLFSSVSLEEDSSPATASSLLSDSKKEDKNKEEKSKEIKKNSKIEPKKKTDDIWDIPTFLRRRRKK
ncbi:MAG TPA: cell division protein FtsZ [Candidatus Wolfebacteria bacterium]|nr:cell division protein FtsZ [Candidatus Wolfebacteria bacterium]